MWLVRCLSILGLSLLSASAAAQLPSYFPAVPYAGFNGGGYFYDRFAGPADHNFVSERIIRLASGDVIVAGRVSFVSPADPSGRMYLGLVRYSASGVRQTWGSGPDTSYTHYNRQYVIYPKGAARPFTRIAGMVAYGDFLYVMGEGPADISGGQRNVRVMVFRLSTGEFQDIHNVFARSEDEYGAGLVAIDAGFAGSYLLAVGTKVSAIGTQRPTFRRFHMSFGTGVLTLDTSIAPANDGYRDVTFPNGGWCDLGACSGSATTVDAYGGGFSPLGIHVGGTVFRSNGTQEFFLLRVRADASLDPSFNGNGMFRLAVDPANAYLYDIAVVPVDAFDPQLDRIYAVGDNGYFTRVIRVNGAGLLEGSTTGRLRRLRAVEVVGDDVIVAGQDDEGGAFDAAIVSLDPALSITGFRVSRFPARRGNGTRYGDSIFNEQVIAPDGTVIATGDVRDDASGGTLMFGTLGIRPDRIFADGFEG